MGTSTLNSALHTCLLPTCTPSCAAWLDPKAAKVRQSELKLEGLPAKSPIRTVSRYSAATTRVTPPPRGDQTSPPSPISLPAKDPTTRGDSKSRLGLGECSQSPPATINLSSLISPQVQLALGSDSEYGAPELSLLMVPQDSLYSFVFGRKIPI
jgi:hypothetical protein